ncbi:hypothetical protein PVAP13_2NG079984 [Panicum virgatum]|uniref:Uncharacterized protein n=1 Tax=Panicum virgatum TaxID=38727 RepID=A0A8T0V6J0_PANVG|nr:hypothetical protein PVAP13_2NG079984 [Panicum virgatum]
MLGFFCNHICVARFVPTCAYRPPNDDHRGWSALDARHGRVLFRSTGLGSRSLLIWNPETGERLQLPMVGSLLARDWNATVLCAAGGACDHLDCHHGPFLVVFVATGDDHITLRVYSSEAVAWSEPTYVAEFPNYKVDMLPSAIVGNALHFVVDSSRRILKYDLATRETYVFLQPLVSYGYYTTIMTMEDGGLGVARMDDELSLSLWSWVPKSDGGMGWAKIRAIDLVKLLSVDAHSIGSDFVVFASGVRIFFVGTDVGLFSFDLNSDQVRKICEVEFHYDGIRGLVPYMSFYTPGKA